MSAHLSFTGRKWILRSSQSLAPGVLIEQLKTSRGLTDNAPTALSDPFLFPEMRSAVERINRALVDGETVAVFGDYDADGITAALQLTRFFRRRGVEPIVYLPDRVTDGYGLKRQSIDQLAEKGVTLLITVDTGISAHAEITHAAGKGIDVIVTDHHRPQGGRPGAFAVIHPQVPPGFPNHDLSGSGVAFTLVRALEGGGPWPDIRQDILLAAIGTVGDLVPLTGENRLLVIKGLACATGLPPSPLKDLIEAVRGKTPLSSVDIAFRVVPRINAAGRMAHPMIAFDALLSGGEALRKLHTLNTDRQEILEELTESARAMVAKEDPFICIADERFTPGIVGLIASRLTEEYGRPSLVGAIRGDRVTASLRSIERIDVIDCLMHPSVRPHLTTCGGHAMAAGCSFPRSAVSDLRSALNGLLLSRGIVASALVPTLTIDASVAPRDLSLGFAESLRALEPFGQGNPEPLLLVPEAMITDLRTVGADGTHLQCRIGGIKAIGFGLADIIDELREARPRDIACRIGVNEWNGRKEVQLFAEDIRASALA